MMLRTALAGLLAAAVLPSGLGQAMPSGWSVLPFSQAIMLAVNFVDSNTGFVAGGDNGVGANTLRSTDGGQTFTNVPLASGASILMAVATAGPDVAVVSGIGLLAGGSQYLTDSGSAFNHSSMPKVSLQQTQDTQRIGDTDGFGVTGSFSFFGTNATLNAVALSNNGGASFRFSVLEGSDPNSPARYGSFPSADQGYVASGAWPANAKKDASSTYLSQNIHLRRSHNNKAQLHFDMPHTRKNRKSVGDGFSAGIWRSVDGYQTWQQVFNSTEFYFNQVSCPSVSVCFAVGENDEYGFAYRSLDAGTTWDQVLQVPGVSMFAAQAISESEVYLGGGVLAASGIQGNVYHSTDAGATFTLTELPNAYVTDFSFPDSTHGWATAMDAQQQCVLLGYVAPAAKRA